MKSMLKYDHDSGLKLCNAETWNLDTREWESCYRRSQVAGVCTMHYQRLRLAGVRIVNSGTRKEPLYDTEGSELPSDVRLAWDTPTVPDLTGSSPWCQFRNCYRTSPNGTGICEVHWKEEWEIWNEPPIEITQPGPRQRKTCTVCGGKHYAKGYCRRHYAQQHSVSNRHDDLEKYISAVHPPDGNYSELDGCGTDEPHRRHM
jgi:hypothetical protein